MIRKRRSRWPTRVAILRAGKIEQIGTPEEIYDRPVSPFVYDFLGNVNLFSGRVKDGAVMIGETPFSVTESPRTGEKETVAFVRPHDIRLTRERNGAHTFPARVVRCHAAGAVATLELARLDGQGVFTAQLSKDEYQQLMPRTGEEVFVELRNLRLFSEDYSI